TRPFRIHRLQLASSGHPARLSSRLRRPRHGRRPSHAALNSRVRPATQDVLGRAFGLVSAVFPFWYDPWRMRTHPVFLRLDGRRCVTVGGDAAAARKASACLAAGGEVTVVSPVLPPPLTAPPVRHLAREYRRGDLA